MILFEKDGKLNLQFNGSTNNDIELFSENDIAHLKVQNKDIAGNENSNKVAAQKAEAPKAEVKKPVIKPEIKNVIKEEE